MPYPHHPSPPHCARCLLGLCHGCEACKDRGGHIVARRQFDPEVVLISGARAHANQEQVHAVIDALPMGTAILTGLADGVDQWADERAKARGMRALGIAAEWKKWGRGAGSIRNEEMVVASDRMIGFPWWGCRGTMDAIDRAKSHQVRCDIVDPQCGHLNVCTTRMLQPIARTRPDFLDITARTAKEAWELRRDVWRRDIHPEQLFAELAKAATKMIAAGSTLSQADKDLRLSGAPSLGAVFAPTYNLLRPALEAREKANTLAANRRIAEAIATDNSAWKTYVNGSNGKNGFLTQMDASRRRYGAIWGLIAAQPSVVFACFCSRPSWWPSGEEWPHHCHRFLVAKEFEKMGGVGRGEVGQPMSTQLQFDGAK